MSGEDEISTFKEGSEQYPVTMRLMPGQRDDPAALSRLLVPSAKQGLIRLDSIAQVGARPWSEPYRPLTTDSSLSVFMATWRRGNRWAKPPRRRRKL